MGGTALSAFFTPRFVMWFGYVTAHLIIAVALALTALLVWMRMKDSPEWHPNTGAVLPKLAAAAKLKITWQMAMNSKEDLSPPKYEWGPLKYAPVAVPGKTKFS